MMFKKGDKVSVVDETFEGVVTKVDGENVHIQSDEGFSFIFKNHQLIKVDNYSELHSEDLMLGYSKDSPKAKRRHKLVTDDKRKSIPIFEVDLHIEKLLPSAKGMDKHEILTYQIDTARKQLEFAIRKRIPRMVFIHGVGEGILKVELDFLLGRYKNISFFDADYQKYGLGATEVRIHQSAGRV